MKILLPEGWPRPRGCSHGVSSKGRQIHVAGTVGWDSTCTFRSADLAGQVRQILLNIRDILAADGARPEHLVRLTWYILDRDEYFATAKEVGAAWREVMGNHYPAMAVVIVAGLLAEESRVEIEATALVPEPGG